MVLQKPLIFFDALLETRLESFFNQKTLCHVT